MGNYNSSEILNSDFHLPGIRMNPKLHLDLDTLKKDPNNKLWLEF